MLRENNLQLARIGLRFYTT